MTTVLLVGIGAVGAHAARRLVEVPSIEHVLLSDRRAERAGELAHSIGAEAITWNPGHPLPDGVDAVAAAVPDDDDLAIARVALEAGVPFATAADDSDAIAELDACDADARDRGVTVAAGCGLAPGLADVLSRHGADGFDEVNEVRVARFGAAGPASARVLRRNRSERAREWRSGTWIDVRGAGPELVGFPEPVGAVDCDLAEGGADLLVGEFPALERASFRLAEPTAPSWPKRLGQRVTRRREPDGLGALRVEVHGTRAGRREVVVYGVVETMAAVVGTVLALSAAHLVGAIDLGPRPVSGVHGLGGLVDPRRVLSELAARDVGVARFEGVPVC